MTILRSTKDNAVFISEPKTQGPKEPGWSSYTTSYQSISETFNVDASSTSVTLVSISREGPFPQQGDGVIAKTPNYPDVYRGTFGNVDSVVSTANDITGLQKDSAEYSLTVSPIFAYTPNFVLFNNDGSKIYSGGSSSDSIYEFDLSVAYDISTITYNNVFFSLSGQDSSPQDVVFNNDGTKMFMVGSSSDNVYEYILSTGYDISTASYSGNSFSLSAQDFNPYDIAFNTDGTKFFMTGGGNGAIFEYTLSTAFDITTLVYTGNSFSFRDDIGVSINASEFTNNGTKLFVADSNEIIYEYNVTVPYDVTSISNSGLQKDLNDPDFIGGTIQGMAFSADATTLITVNSSTDRLDSYSKDDYSFTTSTADISTLGLLEAPTLVARDQLPELSVSAEPFAERCLTEDAVLTKISSTTTQFVGERDVLNDRNFIQLNTGDKVLAFEPETPADINLLTYDGVSINIGNQSGDADAGTFNSDGTKYYFMSSDTIYQYTLSTAFDASTATYDGVSFVASPAVADSYGLDFNNDGTILIVSDSDSDTLVEFELTTAFDVSTASATGTTFSFSGFTNFTQEINFTPDGTRMHLAGANNTIYQLDLSTPFDISTASYNSDNYVVSEDGFPTVIEFTNQGNKAFILGTNSSTIFQYTAATPYDVTTLTYDGVSFSFPGDFGGSFPTDIEFSNDGTKLFVFSAGFASVYQYSVNGSVEGGGASTTSQLVTLTSDALSSSGEGIEGFSEENVKELDISPQSGFTQTIRFGNNGTRLLVLDDSNDRVFQYDLGVPYDITTAVFSGDFLSLSEFRPRGMTLSSTGDNLYVVGSGNGQLIRYSLTTPYTLFPNVNEGFYQINSIDSIPAGIEITPDGSKLIFLGNSDNALYELDLSTPFDISTITYNNVSVSLSSLGVPSANTYSDIVFNSDGTQLYIVGSSIEKVYRLRMSTPYDITTAATDNLELDVGSLASFPRSIAFNDDESAIFIVGSTSNIISQVESVGRNVYTLNFEALSYAPEQITIPSRATTFVEPVSETWGQSTNIVIDDGPAPGSVVVDRTYATVDTDWAKALQYRVAFPGPGEVRTLDFALKKLDEQVMNLPFLWDIGSINRVAGNETASVLNISGTDPRGLIAKPDGTEIYLTGFDPDSGSSAVSQISLTTGYDLTTNVSEKVVVLAEASNPTDISFKSDGTRMFIVDEPVPNKILRYDLSTPWDIDTAAYVGPGSFEIRSQESNPYALEFGDNGSKMYVTGTGNIVYQYTLSTPYEVSTASYNFVSFSVSAQEYTTRALTFNNDGTKMYITGSGSDFLYQYTLTTPWDIDSASYDSVSVDLDDQDFNPYGIEFNNDGTKFFMIGLSGDDISEYTLSTAYDISTLNYAFTIFSINEDSTPYDFTFNDVGSKLFVVGGSSDAIYQYSLSTPYSLSSVSYDGVSFPTGDIESTVTAIKFNNTGTKIYLLGTSNDTVFEFNLAVPYDISTIDSTVGSVESEWSGDSVYFSLDGTIIRALNGTIVYNRFDFPTAWALEGLDRSTTAEDQVRFDEDNNDSNKNIRFKPDGTEMYISAVRNSAENYIYQYSLSVPFDVTTAKFKQQYEDKTPEATGGTGILSSFFINPNTGKEVLISSGNNVYLFDIDAELFTDVSAIDSDLGTSFEINDGWTNIN